MPNLMNMRPAAPRALTMALAAACLLAAMASHAGGGGAYALDWPHAGETLTYRSCGCADACWVAEVRQRRTKVLQARLRCDCATLHYQRGPGGRHESALGACDPINGSPHKPEAIRQRLESLVHPPARLTAR